MTLQSTMGGLIVPQIWSRGGTTAHASHLLDAADEKLAWIFQAPKTGTIDRLSFRTVAITTGGNVDLRLETVDATTGDPSGTLQATNTNVAVTVADSDDNVWKEGTLTAGASVTKGDLLALVAVAPSGFTGNLASMGNIADYGAGWQFPYMDHQTSGTWAKTGEAACMLVRYSDGTYPPIGTIPALSITNGAFNSGSSPDERGLYFQVPWPCRLSGVIMMSTFAGGGTIKVYDSDGSTVLTSLVRDPDQSATANTGPGRYLFPTSVNLLANTNYRITLLPASVTDNTLTTITVHDAAMLDALDGGKNFYLTTRENAGAWSQTTTQRPFIHLLLDAFDDATGSGGGDTGGLVRFNAGFN
jgi:hypothetical protein